ncbi:MAG TPA: DUF4255 domain-containing protein [Anaerolineae bacterium]|nr:DUF4255 domain-containing protein [Anaerolineae bacterium]
MSNFLAIATVTATLRQIIDDAVSVDVAGASVKTVRPNAPANELPDPGVNLFLYQVTPNPAWRNTDVPTRRPNGDLVQQPRAAIDLHYLLTFYGDDGQLEPQRLLGSAVRAMHDQPVLSRQKIRSVINAAMAANPAHFLGDSNLADEVELVKFTPTSLSLEELSKLWSVFFQTSYALSVSYQGTVVLIESRRQTQATLPVRSPQVRAIPFQQPLLESVSPQVASPGSLLTLRGQNLAAPLTRLFFGAVEATPTVVNSRELTVTLPASLPAGIRAVQVRHDLDLGTPHEPHRGPVSNLVAFALAPAITTPAPINVARGAMLTLTLNPPVERSQEVALLIGDRVIPIPARPAGDPPSTTSLAFPIPASFPTGDFLLRVQVDGAQSLLIIDNDDTSPTYQQYIGPTVTIT